MISVIIPVFNCGNYLKTNIKSVLAQTVSDWELILVNDGSTDNSKEIIDEYVSSDSRIKAIHKEKSGGAGPARNSGIDAAEGEYLMFIDADDTLEPNMMERFLSALKGGADAVICGYKEIVEDMGEIGKQCLPPRTLNTKEEIRDFFALTFPEGMAGYLWNKIYKASVVRENNIRFPDMRRLQDGVFNINFFDKAEKCEIISDTLYNYRINPQVDMFRKCPPTYFELIKRFTAEFIEAKSLWGNYSNQKIYEFFANETGTCIENCFGPNWKFEKAKQKEYLQMLRDDELLKSVISENPSVGRYRKFLISNLNNYFLIKVTVFLKTRVKMYFKKFFYKLRG